MFEIGWSEMLVIAVVMIVVVGPKDLPRMLRTIGKFTAKMTSMAGDFRKQFDEALKEAELDDVKTSLDSVRKLDPRNDIRKALNPMEKAAADVRSGIDQMMKPKAAVPSQPASTEPQASEPLKNGSGVDAIAASTAAVASTPAVSAQPLPPIAEPAVPASIPAPPKTAPKSRAAKSPEAKTVTPKPRGVKPAAPRPAAAKAPRVRKAKEGGTAT